MASRMLPIMLVVSVLSACAGVPHTNELNPVANPANAALTLAYSDGRPATTGVDNVNAVLRSVGVRVSTLPLPEAASPLLETSKTRALTPEEAGQLISVFSLHRGELLEEIDRAGRKPEAHRGGFLSISEVDVPPYPKVYDMKANRYTQRSDRPLSRKFRVFHQPANEQPGSSHRRTGYFDH